MFNRIEFSTKIPLACEFAGSHIEETVNFLKREISARYIDRVVPTFGLIVEILDIDEIEPLPILGPNDGRSCYSVRVDAISFKPPNDSIITAKIEGSDTSGLRLSIGGFHDIKIPASWLPDGAMYDPDIKSYVWQYDENTTFQYRAGELCRFRVIETVYQTSAATKEGGTSPMLLIGSMAEAGLGLLNWW